MTSRAITISEYPAESFDYVFRTTTSLPKQPFEFWERKRVLVAAFFYMSVYLCIMQHVWSITLNQIIIDKLTMVRVIPC